MRRATDPRTPHASLRVPHGRHICLLFGDDDDRFRVLARFFRGALEEHHRALYVSDTSSASELGQRFAQFGVDLGEHGEAAAVWPASDAYFPEGRFEPEQMLASLAAFSAAAVATGFGGSRCAGEMSWAARGVPGSERLIEYEMMLTDVIERLPFSGICQYDVRRFDGPTLLSILEVHPYMISRGQILANPAYRGARASAGVELTTSATHDS